MKIFISSHGHLASGLKSSMEILFGPCNSITVFDAYLDERSVQEELEAFFNQAGEGEQIILISDLFGSSVNQAMCMYLERPDTTLVAGANLAFLLGLAGRDSVTRKELEELVEESRKMLKIVEVQKDDAVVNEDEFF